MSHQNVIAVLAYVGAILSMLLFQGCSDNNFKHDDGGFDVVCEYNGKETFKGRVQMAIKLEEKPGYMVNDMEGSDHYVEGKCDW